MLENDIQIHFIDPIATVLRDPPKDTNWARDLAEKLEGEHVTKDLLTACADHLVRQGGKSFPQFKVCLRAIQEGLRGQLRPAEFKASNGYRQGDRITKDTYHDAARAYGRLVVINQDEPMRWSAWRRYAESLGLHMMASRLGPDSTQREWTVPSDMPGQFDPSWVDPDPSEAIERRTAGYYGSDMRRRQADELMSRLPEKLRKPKQEWGGMRENDWQSAAHEEAAAFEISPAALARVGIETKEANA